MKYLHDVPKCRLLQPRAPQPHYTIGGVKQIALVLLLVAGPAFPETAQQVIAQIQSHVGIPWMSPTVDTFKAGDPNTQVTGIAVTMMATMEVLQQAAAAHANLVITHEPTFYNHLDQTKDFEQANDPVWAEKEAFIRDHHMVVWRFHDHWHRMHPDGILKGMTDALGWQQYQNATNPHLFTIPETTLKDLAAQTKTKLGIHALRVVGDPNLKVTNLALLPGAAGPAAQIQLLERSDVQVLLIGEVPEWETIEYVADAAAQHKLKALILLTHTPSEQAGMEECAGWLRGFVKDVPVQFIAAKEPFWLP